MMLLALAACKATVLISPDSATAFGYVEVALDLSGARLDPAEVQGARLGGVPLAELRADGDALRGWVQGHPTGGAVALELDTADGVLRFEDAFTYAPSHPKLSPVAVVGASISMGVQDLSPTQSSQIGGPAARIAALTGAWMPLPLLVDPLFDPITLDEFGSAADCTPPDGAARAASSLAAALAVMGEDPDTRLGRATPELEAVNLAVPGTTVRDLVYGPPEDDVIEQMMTHLALDPGEGSFGLVERSQLDAVEALGPEVLLSFDLLGNDVVDPVLLSVTLDIGAATPLHDLEEDLEDLFYRLDALGAEVFVGTTPDPVWLPLAQDRAAALRAEGVDEAEIQARLDAISANTRAANTLLLEQASRRSYLHIVDVYGQFEQAYKGNLQVAEEPVSLERFGGLLSLDGFHLNDTGGALVADAFLGAMSVALGEELPRPDLGAVLAADPYSRAALGAQGYTPGACTGQ